MWMAIAELRHQLQVEAATRAAVVPDMQRATSSRNTVFPRFHCLSWLARNRWRIHLSSSLNLLGVLFEVWRVWRRWLHSRSQRAGMTWKRFERFRLRYPLPTPRIVHSVYRAQRSR